MTGTARGPERRTRRALQHDAGERKAALPDAAASGPSADADFGDAQRMLRLRVEHTADEIKELHRELEGFTDDELKRIPLLAEGTVLDEGATYLDLQNADREEFKGRSGERVGPENWIVPKNAVDYELWNKLRRKELH